MHSKNVKLIVRKQRKNRYSGWNRLNRRAKKAIAQQVLSVVHDQYDFEQTVTAPLDDLLGSNNRYRLRVS